MNLPASVIGHHLRYSAWATDRLLQQVRALTSDEQVRDFGTADKSAVGTLAHIYRSERLWLARLQEGTPTIPYLAGGGENVESLSREWPILHVRWHEWANSLSDEDTGKLVRYTDLKGNSWEQPLWQIVFHIVNHSTHHRGQVSGFIRAMTKSPLPLDFIAFVRENSPAKFPSS